MAAHLVRRNGWSAHAHDPRAGDGIIAMSSLRLKTAGLSTIAEKVDARERLSFEDGVTLFNATDLFALGWIANRERERRHGARTYFNHNLRLEATNVCEAS